MTTFLKQIALAFGLLVLTAILSTDWEPLFVRLGW